MLVAECVGPNALRLRATRNARLDSGLPSALLPGVAQNGAWQITDTAATITIGRTRVTLRHVPRGMGTA